MLPMRWLLISFQGDLGNFGVRYISANLNVNGIDSRILFIPHRSSRKLPDNWETTVIDFISEQNPDVIGVSLMCCHYHESRRLSEAIRKHFDIPIIWGGLHPTLEPDECIQSCDILCRGEGEIACVELAKALRDGTDYHGIRNFWFRDGNSITRNSLRPHNQDLDSLPFPDYDFSRQWLFHKKKIQPLTYESARHYPPYNRDTHFILSSRGCSFHCAYCCSPALARLAEGSSLRRRSPDSVVQELEAVRTLFPRLQNIVFCDDDFIAAGDEWLDRFTDLYSSKIGLPFMCAANPALIGKKTLHKLTSIGLVGIGVGIQSYSVRVRADVFKRPISDELMDEAIHTVSEFDHTLKAICYDFIVDLPGISTMEVRENIRRLNRVRRNFTINIFPLTSYPGTELDTRLGPDSPYRKGIYRLSNPYEPNYYNRVLRITPHTNPDIVDFFLEHPGALGRCLFRLYYFLVFIAIVNPSRKMKALITWFGLNLLHRLGFKFSDVERFQHFKFEN